MKVYNVEGQILGRVASRIAKDLLNGEDVVVVNAEKAVISGNPKQISKHYLQRVQRGDPKKGPFFPRTPAGIVKRAIRGMLPFHKDRGRRAFRKLRVFVGIPEEFKNKEFVTVKDAHAEKLKCKYITVGDLAIAVGAKKRW